MKTKFSCVLFLLLFVILPSLRAQQKFYLNLNDRSNNVFKVTLVPEKLSDENRIYQFAATSPGTYAQMDIGRFVKSFKAYDKDSNEIATKHESLNQWSISDPGKVVKIVYDIADTWHTTADSDYIAIMGGSSIEDDNVLINGECVFGYFHGMQSEPVYVKIEYPKDWLIGTALKLNANGFYEAESYDQIVDSPILLGKLTKDSTTVSNTKVNVYTYSRTGLIKSSNILRAIKNILKAEDAFTNGLPVDHYTFLFYFGNKSIGALKHNYSSEYIYKEEPYSIRLIGNIKETVAHEFFHVVLPLNIHSELTEKFNFEKPVMSQHLWLYEGVTEWASHILELRDTLITLDNYLNVLHRKLYYSNNLNDTVSLTYLGLHRVDLQNLYPDIYEKGAIVAGLLDIRLLELSKGKRGLREVINELSRKYGPHKPFSEKNFFNDFTAMTYPEIGDFFDKYIKGTEPLPIKQYYSKIGINYEEKGKVDSTRLSLGMQIVFNGKNFVIAALTKETPNFKRLKSGDVIDKINGEKLTMMNIRKIFTQINTSHKVGDTITMTVIRNNKPVDLVLQLIARQDRYIFSINFNATKKEVELRNVWMRNL